MKFIAKEREINITILILVLILAGLELIVACLL